MLRGITIINDPENQGTQLISTGYDPDTIEGMQFTAAVLRMYVARTEKDLAKAEVLAELSKEQDDHAEEGELSQLPQSS